MNLEILDSGIEINFINMIIYLDKKTKNKLVRLNKFPQTAFFLE